MDSSYYAALFSLGNTDEWCLKTDSDNWITGIKIGGCRQWYMMGHAFWSSDFSHKFIRILEGIYYLDETKPKLWETIYQEHLPQLQMKIRRYNSNEIYEFDSLDELRLFDKKYLNHSSSTTMQKISRLLNCSESEMTAMSPLISADKKLTGVAFKYKENTYYYNYETGEILKCGIYYAILGLGILICTLYIAFSRYGKIRLGNIEKPQYSSFQWGTMIFTSTMAADILFYSLCEWALYANEPYIAELGGIQKWASTYPLFHWGPIAWGFYIILAVAFGFMLHLRGMR